MIVEHALLHVTPGRAAQFEGSLAEALPIIESAPGCGGAEVRRQVEDASTYLLLVRWTSVQAHRDFRASKLFAPWRELTHPFYAEAPAVTHFDAPAPRSGDRSGGAG
ncbi:MAG: antibiotic biosynthesis monooxygenase family protein [Acidimicrobiales bacterium]